MFKNNAIVVLASAMLAMPLAVQSQGSTPTAAGKGGTVAADQIVARYKTFAGGEANAKSLVNGLRNGADITLTGTIVETTTVYVDVPVYEDRTVTKQVATGKMIPCVPFQMTPTGPRMCPEYVTQTTTERVLVRTDRVAQPQTVEKQSSLTFPPGAAAPMGFGNIDIALAITEATLRPKATPSVSELQKALLEILGKRASGQGWGDIAGSYGLQLKE